MQRWGRRRSVAGVVGVAGVVAMVLAGCASEPQPAPTAAPDVAVAAQPAADADQAAHAGGDGHAAHGSGATPADEEVAPLRRGERFRTIGMPAAYTPSAPYGEGTDDYRCFLLDPELDRDAWITGVGVEPGARDVVHHVILFRVPPAEVASAQAQDAAVDGPGWTCFGGVGMGGGGVGDLDRAPWLGAWAPGGSESVLADDVGVPLEAGSRVVMQVHYNLRAGSTPDRSATRLRLADGTQDLQPLETMLLPAPVELPCRLGREGPLCDRDAAVDDVAARFGEGSRDTVDGLHVLCGSDPVGPTQSCVRTVREPVTVRAAAGHMHLLGRSIRIEADAGTPRARTLLDVPVWDFDDQAARAIEPARLRVGDTVTVTCTWDQGLRDRLPALADVPERYVVWGEGTTDEMCLGILQVTRG